MNDGEPVFHLLACVSLDLQRPGSKIIKIHLQSKKFLRVLQPHPVSTEICHKKICNDKNIVLCVCTNEPTSVAC